MAKGSPPLYSRMDDDTITDTFQLAGDFRFVFYSSTRYSTSTP